MELTPYPTVSKVAEFTAPPPIFKVPCARKEVAIWSSEASKVPPLTVTPPLALFVRPTLTAWIRANPEAVEKAVRAMYEAEMKRWTIEGGGELVPGAPAQSAAIRKQQLGRRSA